LIGDAAKNQAAANPLNTVFGNFKFSLPLYTYWLFLLIIIFAPNRRFLFGFSACMFFFVADISMNVQTN
jgi:hypothetical protein